MYDMRILFRTQGKSTEENFTNLDQMTDQFVIYKTVMYTAKDTQAHYSLWSQIWTKMAVVCRICDKNTRHFHNKSEAFIQSTKDLYIVLKCFK